MKRLLFFALFVVVALTALPRNPKYYLYFDKVFISGAGEDSKSGAGSIVVYDNLDVVYEGSAEGMGSFKVEFNATSASNISDGLFLLISSNSDNENNQRIMFLYDGSSVYYWDTRGSSETSYSLISTDKERNSETVSAMLEAFSNRTGIFVNFRSAKEIELPLKVDGRASDFKTTIPSGEYEKSYSVRTKSGKMVNETQFKDYEVWSDSHWAKIDLKTDAAFLLKTEANTTGYTRTANIYVKSGDVTTTMTVSQPSEVAKIKRVWVDHNCYSGFVKGMKIHVEFETYNKQGVRGECAAFFFFEDGRKLYDYNGNYRAPDGHVSCAGSFTPPYQNTTYNDFELFLPYNELHINGSADCKFAVEILLAGKSVCSDYYYFKFN